MTIPVIKLVPFVQRLCTTTAYAWRCMVATLLSDPIVLSTSAEYVGDPLPMLEVSFSDASNAQWRFATTVLRNTNWSKDSNSSKGTRSNGKPKWGTRPQALTNTCDALNVYMVNK